MSLGDTRTVRGSGLIALGVPRSCWEGPSVTDANTVAGGRIEVDASTVRVGVGIGAGAGRTAVLGAGAMHGATPALISVCRGSASDPESLVRSGVAVGVHSLEGRQFATAVFDHVDSVRPSLPRLGGIPRRKRRLST